MSRTYEILCHKCKVRLWIGQASSSDFILYSGDKNHEAQRAFYWSHLRHPLEVMETGELPDDYEEIEVED